MEAREVAERLVFEGVADRVAVGVWSNRRLEVGGDAETIFDLASLTKSATALAIAARGIRRRELGEFVVEARDTWCERTPIEMLLAHRAGLQGHVPLYAPLLEGKPIDPIIALKTAANARREDAVGSTFAPVYSDLGYVLAGVALARECNATDAGSAITEHLLRPLALDDMMGTSRELALSSQLDRVAPTEDVPWRGGILRGVVHDENAWALTGVGGSGHAGLFGTVDAVLRFGRVALDLVKGRPSPLGPVDISWTVAEREGGTLRAGFDGKSALGSSAGTVLGPRTFGHLGFTGTSVWIDPDLELVVVVLTNRVHPTRDNTKIRDARPWAHSELAKRGLQ